MNKEKKQLAKNVVSLTIVQIATYLLPLISVPVISRIIGPGKFGMINFAAAYIVYFTLIITYSFDFTATRRISKDPTNEENRNKVFSEVFYTQCLLFILSTIAFIALLYLSPELKDNKRLFIYSYLVVVSTLFTQNWLFQAMQDLSKVALFNILSRLLFTVSILLLVKKQEDYILQPLLIGISQILISIFSFVWAFRKYTLKMLRISVSQCFKLLWEDRTIFLSLVFVSLYSYSSIVILGIYQTSEEVGYYTSASRLIAIAQSLLTMPIAQAFYPFVGKAFGTSKEHGLQLVQKLIPLILLVIGTATVFMVGLGPIVIKLFYGHKFEPAIPAFELLTLTPLLFALNNVLGVQIMLNLKMNKYFFWISVAAAVVNIGLNLLTVKQWGAISTSLVYLVTESFIFSSMYFVLKRKRLNPINLQYFNRASLAEYLMPLKNKFLPARKNAA